jgi:hypothetical protein
MHEFRHSGVCVDTLQKAAQVSLDDRSNGDSIFKFARAVKAFEEYTAHKLEQEEIPIAFNEWWRIAQPNLPPDTDREECLFLFMDAYQKAKTALGSNVIENALLRIDSNTNPPPEECARYESPKLKRLVRLCYELQQITAPKPFFLGVRDAARAIGLSAKSLFVASAYLKGLERDGIIEAIDRQEGGRKATRYFYK